jgi:LAS superfamily LD-carboxypeptidase LdcB
VLGALLAVLTTARAAQIEPSPDAPALASESEGAELETREPALPAPVTRIGYRHGRRHAIEVVTLEQASDVEIEVSTARAFLDMQAAAADDGIELRVESGFRTAEEQRELFLAWRKGHGNKAARPGQSNHQSGRALDISVATPGTLEWLQANAATFRFKRTVKGEPWHWEYVDVPVARDPTKRLAKYKRHKQGKKAGGYAKRAVAKRAAKRPGKVPSSPRVAAR